MKVLCVRKKEMRGKGVEFESQKRKKTVRCPEAEARTRRKERGRACAELGMRPCGR